jgi:hypothetical protein
MVTDYMYLSSKKTVCLYYLIAEESIHLSVINNIYPQLIFIRSS